MPPKFKFTKEQVIEAALDLTRESGISALTARGLAEKLGSSAKPVFGLFKNMEEVRKEVLYAAEKLFHSYQRTDMASGRYPPYKASGMAYIRFAGEEKELFKLLFMRDRSQEEKKDADEVGELVSLIKKDTGLSGDDAYFLHIEMWIFVHGIATMLATGYLDWDMETASKVLSDAYMGLKQRYGQK